MMMKIIMNIRVEKKVAGVLSRLRVCDRKVFMEVAFDLYLNKKTSDVATTMVFLFRSSSSTGCVVGVRSIGCCYRRTCEISAVAFVGIHRRIFIPSSQGTAIHYLHFSAVEHCSSRFLPSTVS
jgi:hypothetical protein